MRLYPIYASMVLALAAAALGPLHAEEDKTPFEYEEYAAVLTKYVDKNGRVNYKGLKADRDKLESFLERVADVDEDDFERWSDKKKIAFLINAYNALTLKVIIDHYPIKITKKDAPKSSILQIPGAWKEPDFEVAGDEYSLDEIEHELLRKRFNEPRIHMALVCAALSCPILRNEPYTGSGLDSQLNDQVRRFLKHPEKFRIDHEKRTVFLSQIFSWFSDDFIKTFGTEKGFERRNRKERAVLSFIAGYMEKGDAEFLRTGKYELKYLHYDWTLNEKK